jgi:molybdopterin-containing oxidoreductase family iron-sulfur binding subunit
MAAEIRAKAEGRELKDDGEVNPACAQSCPAGAIIFGDLNDPKSQASRLARLERGSQLLAELGTAPKVIYLERESTHDNE